MRIRRSPAYTVSQRIRKRIEEIFGWTKTIGGFRKSRYRGVERSHAAGQYVVAALNLLRMAKLFVSDLIESLCARQNSCSPSPDGAAPPSVCQARTN